MQLALRMAPSPERVPWSRIVRCSSFPEKRCVTRLGSVLCSINPDLFAVLSA